MSLHPEPIGEVPAETARVSRAAFPKGTLVTRLRDEFSTLYQDEDFRKANEALKPEEGVLIRLIREQRGLFVVLNDKPE